MSLFDRINTKIITEKKEPISDKEKYYRDRISQKAKDLGYKSGSELERTVDRGIKAVDKKPGGRYPRKGYATGEPFQADDNLDTIRYKTKELKPVGDKIPSYRELRQAKVPGTGKYEASGKSTLRGRFRYPSMDKDFSKAVKSGEVERDVAKRLKTRLGFTASTELGGKKGVDDFTSKVMKNQKGTIGTGKGKDSDLYKILKRDIDNRNPTVPSKVINPKTGTRFRKPMPGGFDAEGGRTGTKAQQARYDMTAERRAAKFDKEIVKQANLPKGLKIPKGGDYNKDPKTGEMKRSSPLQPKELNVKYKAAKLKLDYGGRMAAKDPEIAKMTKAQKKANFEKIKKDIYSKPSSQPSKAPLKFSTYKYDRKNIVPTGLKGKDQPKFKDIRNTIAYKSTTKDRLNLNKRDLATFSKRTKFAGLKNKSSVKYKKTFGDFAKQAGKFIIKNPRKAGLIGLGIAAATYGASKLFGGKKAGAGTEISGSRLRDLPTATYMDSKTGRPIKYTYGGSKKDNPYGRIGSLESSKKLAAGIKDKSIYLSKFKTPGKKT